MITTADGIALHVKDWAVAEGVVRRGSALIIHGLGEHCGRYAHVAGHLTRIGIAVRGYDQRGSGRSGGARGVIPTATALLDDATLVFDQFAAEAKKAGDTAPPFLLGHSMGGAIAARAVTGGGIAPRGLVLSSPALALRMSAFQRVQLAIGSLLVPGLALSNGLEAAHTSHDPQAVAAYEADPLVHDRICARLVQFIIDAGTEARRDAARIRVPVLLLVAGEDQLVDAAGAREFAGRLANGLGTLKWYDGLYHEVFNERPADRARVLADLTGWIASLIEARPSVVTT